MFLTILGLVAFGTVVCLAVSLRAMALLGGGVLETLVFFGIAERPVRVPPRRLGEAAPLVLDEPLIQIADVRRATRGITAA